MALNDIPLFGMLKHKMGWLSARQEVLAKNVAHADLPGYQAVDLKRPDFASFLASEDRSGPSGGQAMQMTQGKHMASVRAGADQNFRTEKTDAWQVTPDGRSVSLEQEMMKVSETVGEYRIAAGLYSKSVNLVRMAIGRT